MLSEKNNNVEFLADHLRENPDSILFARLADAYLKMDRVDEAIQLCESGIKKHPYYVTGHLVLGKSYLANKMYDQAEKEFKRVLLFDPKHLAAHKLYGDLMQEIGWENTCEMSYKKILQIDPLDEVARSRVGEYILEAGKEQDDTEYLASRPAQADIDVESMSPISKSSQEEDLLFQDKEPELETTPKPVEPQQPEADESKEEKFSSILDDIFKDEVVKDPEAESSKPDAPPGNDDLVDEIQKNPESYFTETETSSKEETEQPETDLRIEFEDFEEEESRDEEEAPVAPFDFPAPKQQKDEEDSNKTSHRKKSEGDKIVTPTLGEIYAAQGQYAKAIDVFELLLKKHPDNESYAQKIEMLKKKLEESRDAPKN